jgi:ribosomal protein S18 acetylase RimI-like enzyme
MTDRALVRTLEEMSLNAVPALETRYVGGWLIRTAAGVTGRANSALALAPDAAPIGEVLPEIEARFRAAGIAPRVRLTPLTPPGTADVLAARGWQAETAVLTQLAPIPAEAAHDPSVSLHGQSDADWRRAYAENAGRFGPAELDILGRMHRAVPAPITFARLVEDGRIAAIGFAVAEGGMMSLHEIGTAPWARRGGRAQRILSTLFAWGRDQGATRVWLQVSSDNAPAIALYRRLGFATVYPYGYVRG